MIVRAGVGDGEADRDEVEERRVGGLHAAAAKIVPDMEQQFEAADPRWLALISGASVRPSALVATSRDERARARGLELVELDPHAFGRPRRE